MKLLRNFTMKMVKTNFILWKIAIKHNFDFENTKFFVVVRCVYIYNLSNKKVCVYIIKKHVCTYICVWRFVSINILVPPLSPPNKISWLCSWLLVRTCMFIFVEYRVEHENETEDLYSNQQKIQNSKVDYEVLLI